MLKKIKKMRSTVKFNLDSSNNSIITAEIQKSTDVRDSIAQGFMNKFGEYGRLSICDIIRPKEGSYEERREISIINIESFGTEKEECQKIAKRLDISQMKNLIEAFNEAINNMNKN